MTAFSGVLKLKFGPFWFKTSILLVNVLTFGENARYVLRVERPAICGGPIELPIGHQGFPIKLLPRSADDRRTLHFGIQYGTKGRTLHFLAPTAEVYGHWIGVLREAFHESVKLARRVRKETASTIESGHSYSDRDDCVQSARVKHVTESMRGHRGSEARDSSTSDFYQHHSREDPTRDTSFDNTNDSLHAALTHCLQTGRSRYAAAENVKTRDHGDVGDTSNTDSSGALTPISGIASTSRVQDDVSTNGDVDEGQQTVFCIATDRNGMMSFTVYTPPKSSRAGEAPRPERVFKLPSAEWAKWLARDIRDNEFLPEVFHLTSTSCKRLQLREIVTIAQSFFG